MKVRNVYSDSLEMDPLEIAKTLGKNHGKDVNIDDGGYLVGTEKDWKFYIKGNKRSCQLLIRGHPDEIDSLHGEAIDYGFAKKYQISLKVALGYVKDLLNIGKV